MDAESLVERIDRCIRELEAIKAALMPPPAVNGGGDVDDSADALIDTTSASARTGFPRNTITRWCREGIGVRRGGRWLVSVEKLRARARLNGGE